MKKQGVTLPTRKQITTLLLVTTTSNKDLTNCALYLESTARDRLTEASANISTLVDSVIWFLADATGSLKWQSLVVSAAYMKSLHPEYCFRVKRNFPNDKIIHFIKLFLGDGIQLWATTVLQSHITPWGYRTNSKQICIVIQTMQILEYYPSEKCRATVL